MGGALVPRICAASPVSVAGMISMAGYSRTFVEEVLDQFAYLQRHLPKPKLVYEREMAAFEEVNELVKQGKGLSRGKSAPKDLPFPLPMSYFVDDYEIRPAEVAKELKIPRLFLHGRDDWQVPPSDLQIWQESLKRHPEAQTRFRLYDGLGHLFVKFENQEKGAFQYDEPGHVSSQIITDIVQWIYQVIT